MAIVFLQYSYVYTNAPISFCIPEEILSRIFTWENQIEVVLSGTELGY
jgi:hypothetical protein